MSVDIRIRTEQLTPEEQKRFASAMARAKARREQKVRESAHYQRLASMTPWERSKNAIERLAKDMMRLQHQAGKELMWENALKYMEGIALKGDKQRHGR